MTEGHGRTEPAPCAPLSPADRQRIAAIEANWDARTPVHLASRFYSVADGLDPGRWFAPFEWQDMGPLEGRQVVHLQCHLGTETLAFAARGARAVGLDISGAAVAAAVDLARRAGADIEYVKSDVHDAVRTLDGRRFDVVYTGKGALCYLPDLDRWAETISRLLRPDGRLYVVEFHPLLNALGLTPDEDVDEGAELRLRHDYLQGRGPQRRDASRTYTDGPAVQGATECYEWTHGIGEVVTAVTGAGLRVERLRESRELPWPRWPGMVRAESGWWRLPDAAPRIPLMYALLARP